jgi:hypothetical protein
LVFQPGGQTISVPDGDPHCLPHEGAPNAPRSPRTTEYLGDVAGTDVHAPRHAGETSPVAQQHALRDHGDWLAMMICVSVHLLSPANNIGLICRAQYAATNQACQGKNEG